MNTMNTNTGILQYKCRSVAYRKFSHEEGGVAKSLENKMLLKSIYLNFLFKIRGRNFLDEGWI